VTAAAPIRSCLLQHPQRERLNTGVPALPEEEVYAMELYIIEGVSMGWLLSLPLSVIFLLWLVGIAR